MELLTFIITASFPIPLRILYQIPEGKTNMVLNIFRLLKKALVIENVASLTSLMILENYACICIFFKSSVCNKPYFKQLGAKRA